MAKLVGLAGAFAKPSLNIDMIKRELCTVCNTNPRAINYVKDEVYHYRSRCAGCIRKGKRLKPVPSWAKSGYVKKPQCDKCGFKFKFPVEQSAVFHVDGNLKNTAWGNLKTLCLNCVQEVYKSRVPWKPAEIVPDF
jgi:hypothetical protein